MILSDRFMHQCSLCACMCVCVCGVCMEDGESTVAKEDSLASIDITTGFSS